jgi:hypothetical protein
MRVLVLPLIGLALCGAARAQTTVTLMHDNDEWAGTDEEYTEGSRLSVVSADWGKGDLAQWAAAVLPGIEPGDGLSAGFGLGEYLYVPRNIATSAPLPGERAYAGWLHGSALLVGQSDGRMDAWKFDLGVVGPSAGGEDLVKFFHSAFSGREMNGWDNQIEDRIGAQAAWGRRWRNVSELGGLELDVSPAVGLEAGTVSVGAKGGLMLRLGTGLRDDFGPPRATSLGSLAKSGEGFSGYVFASVEGRWSGYDVFLDEAGGSEGDPVRGGSAVTREDWRTETSLGVVFAYGGARATFAWTEQSKLYEQQPGSHRFGEVTLGFAF